MKIKTALSKFWADSSSGYSNEKIKFDSPEEFLIHKYNSGYSLRDLASMLKENRWITVNGKKVFVTNKVSHTGLTKYLKSFGLITDRSRMRVAKPDSPAGQLKSLNKEVLSLRAFAEQAQLKLDSIAMGDKFVSLSKKEFLVERKVNNEKRRKRSP